MVVLLRVVFVTALLSSCASCQRLHSSTCPELATKLLNSLLSSPLVPELRGFQISCVAWNTDGAYYLKSSPRISTLYRSARKRIYDVYYNPRLAQADFGPSIDAQRSILLHELQHVGNYTRWSSATIVKFAARYAVDASFLRTYEHATDACALEAGARAGMNGTVARGLSAYRTWIYGVLSPKDRATKRLEYMTPQNISSWEAGTYRGPTCACECF